MALVFDWQNAGQPDDLLNQTVAALRQGGIAAIPSEVGYVFVAAASSSEAAAALDQFFPEPVPLTFPVADVAEVGALFSERTARLVRRCWPGPLTLVLSAPDVMRWGSMVAEPVARRLQAGGELQVWMPTHSAPAALFRKCDFPLVLLEPPAPVRTSEAAADGWNDRLAVVWAAGEIGGGSTTRVRIAPEGFAVTRAGMLPESELRLAEACWIVLVCTGNTCRSPMAEAFLKMRLAERLQCSEAELPKKGFRILSAGLAAYDGDGAAPEAVEVIRSLGGDLTEHRSRPLASLFVAEADHLIAMTRSHLLAIVSRYPILGGTLRLLCGHEGDLDDPLGCGDETYRECARKILRHVDRFLFEMRLV